MRPAIFDPDKARARGICPGCGADADHRNSAAFWAGLEPCGSPLAGMVERCDYTVDKGGSVALGAKNTHRETTHNDLGETR